MKWQTQLKHQLKARRYFLLVIIAVIGVREGCVWLMTQLKHPEFGNFLGLFVLLFSLIIIHRFKRIPKALYQSANVLMKHNTFAILPVMGGCYFVLMQMGHVRYLFLLICLLSVAVSLWLYAHLARRYLS